MPARVPFDFPHKGVTEIRVHGVGGTGPDALLDDPHPVQVAGDGRAGFYRRAHPEAYKDPPPGKWTLEAYSWGGLTSRKASRALWIMLLPFTLTNVAGWTVVHFPPARLLARLQERLCRLTALLATILMVVGIAAITGDIIGVQCGRYPACRSGHWWLAPFGVKLFERGPLRRLIVGVIPAMMVALILVWLARRNRKEYEEFAPTASEDGESSVGEGGQDERLDSDGFWYRPSFVRDLTALHLAGALSYVGFLLAAATNEVYAANSESRPGLLYAAWIVCGVAFAGAVLWILLLGGSDSENQPWLARYAPRLLAAASGVALLVTAIGAWRVHLAYPTGGLQAFRLGPLYLLLLATGVAVLIALLQIVAWLWPPGPQDGALVANNGIPRYGVPVLILFAVLVVVVVLVVWTRRIEVVYLILLLELLAAWGDHARVPLIVAGAGLGVGVIAHFTNEPVWVHLIAVAALLAALLILYDWHWPRTEYRWGAPPIIGLLGIVLLGAVLAGASTRVSDYLDKKQSRAELAASVNGLIQRQVEEDNLTDPQRVVAQRVVNTLYERGTPNAETLIRKLKQKNIPKSTRNRVYALAIQGDRRPIDIRVPKAYEWIAVGILGSLLLSIIAMFLLFLAERLDRPPTAELPHDAPTCPPGAQLPTASEDRTLSGAVKRMMVIKQIAGAGDLLITFIIGLLFLGALIAFVDRAADAPSFWGWTDQEFPAGWRWLVGASTWIVAALPLLSVAAIRKSYSNEASRRKIGIIWDLLTFWPRRFHPLAPPPYPERAVPELGQRLRQASESGKCVILATHSQGTVVGYASLFTLDDEHLKRVTFMTYGSPLGSYYRRFFPTYFSTRDFDCLEVRLQDEHRDKSSWRNFWRPTDPVAGCVFAYEPSPNEFRDTKVLDPWWGLRYLGQPLPHLQVHSDYMDDPTLRKWVADAVGKFASRS